MGWDKDGLIRQHKERRNNNNNNTNKRIYEASGAQCNCSPPGTQCSAHSRAAIPPPPGQLPQLHTEHDIIWYRISPWLVWVSCPGCDPSQLLVKINSFPAELRTPVCYNWTFSNDVALKMQQNCFMTLSLLSLSYHGLVCESVPGENPPYKCSFLKYLCLALVNQWNTNNSFIYL